MLHTDLPQMVAGVLTVPTCIESVPQEPVHGESRISLMDMGAPHIPTMKAAERPHTQGPEEPSLYSFWAILRV